MLELTMNMWVEWVTTEGLILSELLIKEKGHQFAQALSIPEESLTFSNGFLGRSTPLKTLSAEHIKLQELLSHYDSEDIYNADATGFCIQGRPVLLLVDNASSHMAPETNNLTKVQDDTMEIDDSAEEIEEIYEQPQGKVSKVSIKNCWKATKIIPETNEPKESESDDEPEDEIPEVNDATILPIVTENILTDDGIIEAVLDEFCNDYDNNDDDNNNDEPPSPPITQTETIEALEKVIKYQKTLDIGIGFNEYELSVL
ncbi:31002_t:CDS:2 [Gigaspora margarita]|uniref:31002_t:CDS:1 n=1 Tax=Gigaspora margarita TaxID=4874 RepID=A0ABN7WJX4_GIGMA|nr:31002_t:CDS:2 [Gigaspora margarita]